MGQTEWDRMGQNGTEWDGLAFLLDKAETRSRNGNEGRGRKEMNVVGDERAQFHRQLSVWNGRIMSWLVARPFVRHRLWVTWIGWVLLVIPFVILTFTFLVHYSYVGPPLCVPRILERFPNDSMPHVLEVVLREKEDLSAGDGMSHKSPVSLTRTLEPKEKVRESRNRSAIAWIGKASLYSEFLTLPESERTYHNITSATVELYSDDECFGNRFFRYWMRHAGRYDVAMENTLLGVIPFFPRGLKQGGKHNLSSGYLYDAIFEVFIELNQKHSESAFQGGFTLWFSNFLKPAVTTVMFLVAFSDLLWYSFSIFAYQTIILQRRVLHHFTTMPWGTTLQGGLGMENIRRMYELSHSLNDAIQTPMWTLIVAIMIPGVFVIGLMQSQGFILAVLPFVVSEGFSQLLLRSRANLMVFVIPRLCYFLCFSFYCTMFPHGPVLEALVTCMAFLIHAFWIALFYVEVPMFEERMRFRRRAQEVWQAGVRARGARAVGVPHILRHHTHAVPPAPIPQVAREIRAEDVPNDLQEPGNQTGLAGPGGRLPGRYRQPGRFGEAPAAPRAFSQRLGSLLRHRRGDGGIAEGEPTRPRRASEPPRATAPILFHPPQYHREHDPNEPVGPVQSEESDSPSSELSAVGGGHSAAGSDAARPEDNGNGDRNVSTQPLPHLDSNALPLLRQDRFQPLPTRDEPQRPQEGPPPQPMPMPIMHPSQRMMMPVMTPQGMRMVPIPPQAIQRGGPFAGGFLPSQPFFLERRRPQGQNTFEIPVPDRNSFFENVRRNHS